MQSPVALMSSHSATHPVRTDLTRNTDTDTVSTTVSYGLTKPSATQYQDYNLWQDEITTKVSTPNSLVASNNALAPTPLQLLTAIEFNMVSSNLVLNVATAPFSVSASACGICSPSAFPHCHTTWTPYLDTLWAPLTPRNSSPPPEPP